MAKKTKKSDNALDGKCIWGGDIREVLQDGAIRVTHEDGSVATYTPRPDGSVLVRVQRAGSRPFNPFIRLNEE